MGGWLKPTKVGVSQNSDHDFETMRTVPTFLWVNRVDMDPDADASAFRRDVLFFLPIYMKNRHQNHPFM